MLRAQHVYGVSVGAVFRSYEESKTGKFSMLFVRCHCRDFSCRFDVRPADKLFEYPNVHVEFRLFDTV